jgi:hypothetical protein
MENEGSTFMLAAFAAFMLAAVIVGLVLLRNWFAFEVVAHAVAQPYPTFPATQFQSPAMLTPWAMTTPLFDTSIWYWSTPTPVNGDVFVTTP